MNLRWGSFRCVSSFQKWSSSKKIYYLLDFRFVKVPVQACSPAGCFSFMRPDKSSGSSKATKKSDCTFASKIVISCIWSVQQWYQECLLPTGDRQAWSCSGDSVRPKLNPLICFVKSSSSTENISGFLVLLNDIFFYTCYAKNAFFLACVVPLGRWYATCRTSPYTLILCNLIVK